LLNENKVDKKIRVGTEITQELHNKLLKIAKADVRSLASLIAKALTEYANNHNISDKNNLNSN
jgi:hypothetical protein